MGRIPFFSLQMFIIHFYLNSLQISGLGVLIAGALVLADVGEFSHFIEGRVVAPPIVLIVVGALVFLVASLGCYGAIRESPPLLTLVSGNNPDCYLRGPFARTNWHNEINHFQFAVCLAIIFIVELAVGIAAIAFKSDLENALRTSLQKTIRNSNTEDLRAWDNAQKKLQCCGLDGPADWVDLSRDRYLRPSCCRPEYIDAQTKDCRNALPLHKDKYYQVSRKHVKSLCLLLVGEILNKRTWLRMPTNSI